MKILVKPVNNQSIIDNIDSTNIISTGNNQTINFEKGYYTLSQILAKINSLNDIQIKISVAHENFGCIEMINNTTIDFSNSPDICNILGLKRKEYPGGRNISLEAIDITRNRQLIQIFSTIVRSSDLQIANQNNNLLSSVFINDPEKINERIIEDVKIPIIRRFEKLYFSFRDLDGIDMKYLHAEIEFQIIIDDIINPIQNEVKKSSQFSLA